MVLFDLAEPPQWGMSGEATSSQAPRKASSIWVQASPMEGSPNPNGRILLSCRGTRPGIQAWVLQIWLYYILKG